MRAKTKRNVYTKNEKLEYWASNKELANAVFNGKEGWTVVFVEKGGTLFANVGGSSFKDIGHGYHFALFAEKAEQWITECLKHNKHLEEANKLKLCFKRNSLTRMIKGITKLELSTKPEDLKKFDKLVISKNMLILDVVDGIISTSFKHSESYCFYEYISQEYPTHMINYSIEKLNGRKVSPKGYMIYS